MTNQQFPKEKKKASKGEKLKRSTYWIIVERMLADCLWWHGLDGEKAGFNSWPAERNKQKDVGKAGLKKLAFSVGKGYKVRGPS
jgi:hypothetical protein